MPGHGRRHCFKVALLRTSMVSLDLSGSSLLLHHLLTLRLADMYKVCGWCDCTDSALLDPCSQDQDECSSGTHIRMIFSRVYTERITDLSKLEIIYVRYGRTAHLVFMLFAFITNILVGSQLLLGGSAVVTSLTGMNVYAAVFLIPVGVCAYVILGGLRATFLCKSCIDLFRKRS